MIGWEKRSSKIATSFLGLLSGPLFWSGKGGINLTPCQFLMSF